ncbi:mannosylglycerate hydrolase [Enterococcus rivorum]|uniref:Alpha-mannosidase n=2 Tax=Enterococcus rivorum TaxID=762845 RepID=A0A1E5L105_9ENTE|nr:mannosylglycerate hydrolase [Enterococcus rivorum]MBP2098656.1 mannosylglycerate hydrolase [Enterococcus rivorum]OEH83751.1 alpha-mannosidase [Enterococcus rivorum]
MKNVHIVPHMHWDREWYFSTEESRILLVNNMTEIMDMLEEHPEYPCYVLDGQTAILEDYFEVCPEQRERVEKLVKAGRLIIGPWYTQTDELVVGAESITRNLLYGMSDCEAFGEPMKIGYLPDSFGQSSQMPQILNGFGIDYAIFWRGISERHGTDKTEFYWEGDDGSKVLTQLLPLGYAIGKYLPEEASALKERMDKYFPVLDKGATSDHIILPNGHDQMPVQRNIFTIIELLEELYPERKFFLSRYEHVFNQLKETIDLPVIKGEFIDGKYSRVHRSIFSTRMDIKAANARIENKITNILEPLASIAYSLGHEYHHGLIEGIWKEIMKNHAHDSIGCCCSDKVHAEIMARFINAEERTDRLIEFYQRKIVEGIPSPESHDKVVLFNLLPKKRKEVVTIKIISKLPSFVLADTKGVTVEYQIISQEIIDPGLIDRQIVHYGNYEPFIEYTIQVNRELPAMGYDTLYVKAGEQKITQEIGLKDTIESEYYIITAKENGTFKIVNKENGEVYDTVFAIEDCGDDGDEYDFSPLREEVPSVSSDYVKATIGGAETQFCGKLTTSYQWKLPKNLDSRREGIVDSFVEISLTVTVPKNSKTIQLTLSIDNQCGDHRMRLLIPTKIQALVSIADNQFGIIERSVEDSATAVWETEDWDERPDTIFPFLSHVSLTNTESTVAVFSNSSREYQITGSNFDKIAITLFRGIGVLGKEKLLRRPGRPSGIKLATPDSQMLGKITLDFGIYFEESSFSNVEIGNRAKEYLTPIVFYNQIPYHAMKLNPSGLVSPVTYSLFTQENPKIVLSTLKKAEKDQILLARFYNPTNCLEELSIKKNDKMKRNYDSYKLNEEKINSDCSVKIKPNQVTTVKIAD